MNCSNCSHHVRNSSRGQCFADPMRVNKCYAYRSMDAAEKSESRRNRIHLPGETDMALLRYVRECGVFVAENLPFPKDGIEYCIARGWLVMNPDDTVRVNVPADADFRCVNCDNRLLQCNLIDHNAVKECTLFRPMYR